jgi:hypothetical protein
MQQNCGGIVVCQVVGLLDHLLHLHFISDPAVIKKILEHLGLPIDPPPLSPVKIPVDEQDFFSEDFPDETVTEHPYVFSEYSNTSRAPPD